MLLALLSVTGVQQRPPHRDHPPLQSGRPYPHDRPPDEEWLRHAPPHPHDRDAKLPSRSDHHWSPGREHEWRPPDHHGRSPPREWDEKWHSKEEDMYPHSEDIPLLDKSHGVSDGDERDLPPSSSDTDSVHEAVAHLAEQMKSVKGLASKLNLPNSPKTAEEWQEVAKMVAAAAAAGGSNQQVAEEGEDDTQKRVAAMLANDSDSDTEKPVEEKKPSPAREFDGTYIIPPEFCKSQEDKREHYSMDYGHGEHHLGHRSSRYDYQPDDPYRHSRPPFWDDREREHFPPRAGPYHRPLSPQPHRRHLPQDYKGMPPQHLRHTMPTSEWCDSRPRTPPYPQYGPPLPHDIPTSMLDEMTSDQQLLLAAAVNSGSGKNQ